MAKASCFFPAAKKNTVAIHVATTETTTYQRSTTNSRIVAANMAEKATSITSRAIRAIRGRRIATGVVADIAVEASTSNWT